MTDTDAQNHAEKRVLFCNCSYSNIVPNPVRQCLKDALRGDQRVIVVDDLCGLAAGDDALLGELAASEDVIVIACHRRAVKWLFTRAGAPLREDNVTFLNMLTQSAEEILDRAALGGDVASDLKLPLHTSTAPAPLRRAAPCSALPGAEHVNAPGARSVGERLAQTPKFPSPNDPSAFRGGAARTGGPPDWTPWYPVIDYDRCKHCRQCHDFCLFGVYDVEEGGRVIVANPASCKLNCPACARICPQAAIIFPKCGEAPIDGAEIDDEEQVRAQIKVNVDEILGSDVYNTLRHRQRKARSRLLDRKRVEQALREREECKQCEATDGTLPCSPN